MVLAALLAWPQQHEVSGVLWVWSLDPEGVQVIEAIKETGREKTRFAAKSPCSLDAVFPGCGLAQESRLERVRADYVRSLRPTSVPIRWRTKYRVLTRRPVIESPLAWAEFWFLGGPDPCPRLTFSNLYADFFTQ